jgi:hypothetical protein
VAGIALVAQVEAARAPNRKIIHLSAQAAVFADSSHQVRLCFREGNAWGTSTLSRSDGIRTRTSVEKAMGAKAVVGSRSVRAEAGGSSSSCAARDAVMPAA